ncbi:hypothetical protein GCM10007301_26980 [Azorhizobium oxalatiphilum]|uniref:Uncharacterized protein n=1 Tax=Azorhizobium oxalatiphilum TaxID=980631 RepID=A0A917C386_9HYPH|nr:hypothetical protein [Azorhizobium oxalatiphilum]GGF65893.1 hypothetical protein GCM10007301_26980 [Azorhizobium oxalatiphilum]
MPSRPPLRDGLRPLPSDPETPARDTADDAVPPFCLCRKAGPEEACPSDTAVCEDVPLMFFS